MRFVGYWNFIVRTKQMEQIADGVKVVWGHRDLMTGGLTTTAANGGVYVAADTDDNAETEPLGASIPTEDPFAAGADDGVSMPSKSNS